jgi:hypothetical protein
LILKENVPKNTFFLGESFFEFSKMDIYKCPKMENPNFNLGKIHLGDHNLILSCGDRKNNSNFVTTNFKIFIFKRI